MTLEPLPGIAVITVESSDDFDLSVDEASFGASTRVEVELERGLHSVHIRGGRIKPVTKEIDIAGYGEIQHFPFATEPGNSALAVQTVPAGAQVFLDGAPVGRGGFDGYVDLGDHEIAVRLDGYHDQQRRFTAEPEQRIDLGSIELLPKAATLAVASTPSGAAVLVDGTFAGSTPVRISLQPLQTHRLTVRKTGHELLESQIEPGPGEIIERTFRLGSHTWRASVTSDIEARVTVNGVDRGLTPAAVTVREGDRIEVSRAGYQSQQVIVDPVGGNERVYAFTMMRPNEYAFHQADAEVSLANGIVLRKFPPVRIRLRPAGDQAPTVEKDLTRPFYMGLREVAYKEYLAFDAQPIPRGLTPEHPVTDLAWAEAARYCNWLSGQEGFPPVYEFDAAGELRRVATGSLGYRLPTEAEWEAVAGYDFAGSRLVGPFPWGGQRPYPGLSPISPAGKLTAREVATFFSTTWTTTRAPPPSGPIPPISTACTISRATSPSGSPTTMRRSPSSRQGRWSTHWGRRGASTMWSKGRAFAPVSCLDLPSPTAPLCRARAIPSASASRGGFTDAPPEVVPTGTRPAPDGVTHHGSPDGKQRSGIRCSRLGRLALDNAGRRAAWRGESSRARH